MKSRVRFAPSPTGFMHIGNLRTAIFEYLVAKHDDGDFILRIEDTDQERKVEGAVDFIYNTLNLCNFEINEGPLNEGKYGPYIQSERLSLYTSHVEQLIDNGHAYRCFCTPEELEQQRKIAESRKVPFQYDGRCKKLTKEQIEEKLVDGISCVVRQAMPKTGITTIEDVVYGVVKIENNNLEDQILLKSDGYPTYNFANVIDDHLMEITHVIRGKEYLDQTAKYNLLYDNFGWDKPTYIHVAMVLGDDGTKLSKRNGDASFMDLYSEGYLPEAIVNYLVLLGWSPTTNKEVFTMEELIKEFDPTRISKSSSQYDIKKLQWFNAQYIKKLELNEYIDFVKPYLSDRFNLDNYAEEWINHLLKIYQTHIAYGKEIVDVTSLFFEETITLDDECSHFMDSDETISNTVSIFKEEIENISVWSMDNINQAISNVKERANVKGKLLFMPLRIAVSGVMHGPELPDTIYLIGKEVVLNRLNN